MNSTGEVVNFFDYERRVPRERAEGEPDATVTHIEAARIERIARLFPMVALIPVRP